MSNLEASPAEQVCAAETGGPRDPVEILTPREVPLGGPRAMNVRRTLPQRARSLIGAWCFLDHYGPDDVAATGGMNVPRHPHTGLATVSWLFTGEIEHRDSAGFHAFVRPGHLYLMTAGRGISHSEFSTPATTILHGAQLWLALPDAQRHAPPNLDHYAPDPVTGDGWEVRVFLGSMAGSTSPVATYSPTLGAEVLLDAGAAAEFAVDPRHEHGVLVDTGRLVVDGETTQKDHLAYVPPGRSRLRLEAGEGPVRALVIGGTPLGEQIVMWWNFVGRSHDDVVAARADWMREIGAEPADSDAGSPRFGQFPPREPAALPAPALPNARMRPRG